jgi:hypothetical protein
MKTISAYLKVLVFGFAIQAGFSPASHAQGHIQSSQTPQSGNFASGYGRDFWFAIPQNYDTQTGKFFNLYVGSATAATINVDIGGSIQAPIQIAGGEVSTISIPEAMEMQSSGIVEQNKTVHVWSDDADLSVYLLSRNPYTTDGMYVIPTVGWGKEYVVVAYQSLDESFGSTVYDYPSEFIIVAHRDNTLITITPSCDIRMDHMGLQVEHPRGIPFSVLLSTGESVEYQAVRPDSSNISDLSGTIVSADHAIGVIGACACANIPGNYPYCDHVLDMVPPLRTLSSTYYTAPFAHRVGGDSYGIISTKAGQIVSRNGNPYHTFTNANEAFFRADITEPSVWTSDASFLLAQYINSTTWQDTNGKDNKGVGDPAMVVINPEEQFLSTVVFQTPEIASLQSQKNFTNFINIILPVTDEATTTLDNVPVATISGMERLAIPGTNWETIRITFDPGAGEGAHTVNSTAGVGVYLYGYGDYDSYAWAGNLGVVTPLDSDKAPPSGGLGDNGLTAHITFDENRVIDSKLGDMKLDSLVNMKYMPDKSFLAGEAVAHSYYDIEVVDPKKDAYAKVSAYDVAGNRTQVVSRYAPQSAAVSSSLDGGSSEYENIRASLDRGESVALLPVVPNPISSHGTIRFVYGIGQSSVVDLAIFDLLGKKIASVVDETKPGGIYDVKYSLGSSFSAGSYIYRLSVNGKTISGKLIVE